MKNVLFILWTGILFGICFCKECPSAKADIAFVVDDSSSVQRSNFKLELALVQDIVQTLEVGRSAVQVGFVSFSNTVKHQFYFNDKANKNKADLLQKIGNIRFRRGGTDIAKALRETFEDQFQDSSKGGRDDAEKILVLITDGTSPGTEEISRTIRNVGIDIFCVGITDGVEIQQLADIAGDPSKVFDARSFSELGNIAEILSTTACDAIQPEVRPCDSAPCQHSGTCVEKDDGTFTCSCTDNYRGTRCEIVISPCESGPCQHSGTCVDHENGQFSCLCVKPLYLGQFCEIKADQCEPNPCLNGGTCSSSTFETFSCQCPTQFMGALCHIEVPVKPCEPNPCLNSGVCVEAGEDFICRCMVDYMGSTCEIERTACIPSPCKNDAVCIEGEGSQTSVCLCKKGFGDINCRTGGLIPKVAEIGDDAVFSCKNSQKISTHHADIDGVELNRVDRMKNQDVRLKTIEKTDIHRKFLCHYMSELVNSTSSMNLPLIVVEKKSEKIETGTRLSCSAHNIFKNVDIIITVNDVQDEQTLTLGEGGLKDNTISTGETKYTVAEPSEVIEKSVLVDDQNAEVRCSVTYHKQELWSGLLAEKHEVQPKEKGGFPIWVWILLGIVIVGIVTAVIVYNVCPPCRRGAIGKRKSRSEDDDNKKGEEFTELDKKHDLNSVDVENNKENDESKVPLKSDT